MQAGSLALRIPAAVRDHGAVISLCGERDGVGALIGNGDASSILSVQVASLEGERLLCCHEQPHSFEFISRGSLFAQRRRYAHNSALHLPPPAEGRRICNIWRTITGDQ